MCEAELGADAARLDVVCFDGLVVDFAKENDVTFLVRGLRAFSGASPKSRVVWFTVMLTAAPLVVQTLSTSSEWRSSTAS